MVGFAAMIRQSLEPAMMAHGFWGQAGHGTVRHFFARKSYESPIHGEMSDLQKG